MSVLEGVSGADQETLRPVSDADETPGLPGAQGGSPDDLHSSVTVTVTVIVFVWLLESVTKTWNSGRGSRLSLVV